MDPSSFNVDKTLGAMLIGTLVSYTLFGLTTTQAYIYHGRFPNDPCKMKAMVAAVWFGELGHVICIGHALYVMIITDFGHPERLLHIPNSLFAATFLGGLVSSGVQSFFAYRIYVLSRSWWIPCMCWALSLFRIIPSNVTVFAYGIREPLPDFVAKWSWMFNATWAASAANDLLIAGTLVFLLYRQRSRAIKSTAAVVDKLIKWTIETGVMTSVVGIIMLAFFVAMPASFIWMAWFLVIARLFSISLFASLNSRATFRAQKEVLISSNPPAIVSHGGHTNISATLGGHTNLTGGIEMHKVTMTSYDE